MSEPKKEPVTRRRKSKFIHYGTENVLSYRHKARDPAARSKQQLDQRNQLKLQERHKQQQRKEERLKRNKKTPADDGVEAEYMSVSLMNSLTSFKRDQLLSYPVNMNPEDYRLESEWFSMFSEVIFLPQLRSTSKIFRPQEAFFSSALVSAPAYENLVMLPAARARAELYGNEHLGSTQDVIRLQAKALETYRSVLGRVQETQSASHYEFEVLYAITFAFMDGGYQATKEKAYNAIQLSNLYMVTQLRNRIYTPIPIVDWIATIMPVPGSSFARDGKYNQNMRSRIEFLLEFIAEAQSYAQAESYLPRSTWRTACKPGSALRQVLTTSVFDSEARQPHPTFFKLCRVRALNYIHQRLISFAQKTPPDKALEARFLEDLERIAGECSTYKGPQAVSLFLWALFTYSSSRQQVEFAKRDEALAIPSKYLLAVRGISFSSEMTAWLLQDRNISGQVALPLLDYDAVKESLFGRDPEPP